MFSTWEQYTAVHQVESLHHFIDLISEIYPTIETRPRAFLLDQIYDFKSWLGTHIREIKGHSQPHAFRFVHDSTGKVGMFYKMFHSTDSEWHGMLNFDN